MQDMLPLYDKRAHPMARTLCRTAKRSVDKTLPMAIRSYSQPTIGLRQGSGDGDEGEGTVDPSSTS